MNVRDKLAEYAQLLNRFGENAPEVKEFVSQHLDDEELMNLCELTLRLQTALTAPATSSHVNFN